MAAGSGRGGATSDINVTPLVDVVLVLLIVFMVLTPLMDRNLHIAVVTVATVVLTHDLAKGVLAGVLLSALVFARTVAKLVRVTSTLGGDGRRRSYTVTGEVFFVSVESFNAAFDLREQLEQVDIDLTHAHVWDASAVAAIDRVVLKFRAQGVEVSLKGLNEASATLLERLAVHDKPGAALGAGH